MRTDRGILPGSCADVWIKRGEKRGEKKGRLQGKRKMLRLVLTSRFGRIPRRVRSRIDQATTEGRLDRWLVRAAHVSNLDEIEFGA